MPTPRPSTAPDFLLSRSTGSVRTQGALKTFSSIGEAGRWLASNAPGRHSRPPAAGEPHEEPMIVGAIPFEIDKPAALTAPRSVIRSPGPLEPPAYYRAGASSPIEATITGLDPSKKRHLARVEAARRTIERTALDKVVLARAVTIAFARRVDPRALAARLIDASPTRDGFLADLSPAGGAFFGHTLVGSSPEVLVKKRGRTVTAFPLAGSAPRAADPADDRLAAGRLAASAKDLGEHRFVVEHLKSRLGPLCETLDVPDSPILTSTNELWHLATPIRGTLADEAYSALELVAAVHPTPAVCGTPTDAAMTVISGAETDRGFYGGAVGWADARGDGEFMVAIRCAEIDALGARARAWGGGGIVADSDPETELAETTTKLSTVLRCLGIDTDDID